MKHTGRAVTALLLLVSGYLGALVLALAALVGLLRLVASGPSVGTVAVVVVPLLGLAVLGHLGSRARAARAAGTDEGIPLAQTAQPRLWADVQSLSDRVDSTAPDEIWVVDRVSAELVEDSLLLGLRPGRRRLVLGIPLMVGLSAEQLRCVVAHELAHDSLRQPGPRTTATRGVASLRRLRAGLGDSLTDRLLLSWARTVEEVARPALLAQELTADRIAAELVGSRTAVAALKELGPLDEAWQEFCEHYVLPGVLVGQRPTEVFAGFVEFLDDDDRQTWMEQYDDRHPAGPEAAPGHPRQSERIAAIKELQTNRQLDFSGAAEDILDRRDVVFEALEAAVTGDSGLEPGVFERVVPRGTAARVAQQVAAVGTTARQLDLWPLQESLLLQVVRAGREAPLMRALAPDADGDTLDTLAGRMVADLAAHRLVEAGRASYTLSWGAAPALVDRAGETLDPWSVAARATRSAEGVEELRAWLTEHQVRLGRPMADSARPLLAEPRREPLRPPLAAATAPEPLDRPADQVEPELAETGEVEETDETDAAAAVAAVASVATVADDRDRDGEDAPEHPRADRGPNGAHRVRPSAPLTPAALAPLGATPAPAAFAEEGGQGRRPSPRDLMAPLLRRISGQPERVEAPTEGTEAAAAALVVTDSPSVEAPAPAPDPLSMAAVRAIVRDRWSSRTQPAVPEVPTVQRPPAPTEHAPVVETTPEPASPEPASPEVAQTADGAHENAEEQPAADGSAPTQREALKSALKELDRLRRAEEEAEREAAVREAAEARQAAYREAAAARQAAAFAARDADTAAKKQASDEAAAAAAEAAAAHDAAQAGGHEEQAAPRSTVLNADLAAAIAAFGGAPAVTPAVTPAVEAGPAARPDTETGPHDGSPDGPHDADPDETHPDETDLDEADPDETHLNGTDPDDAADEHDDHEEHDEGPTGPGPRGRRSAPEPVVVSLGPDAPPATDEDAPAAAAFTAGPVAEELTGVLAAAAPIAGSARGTLVISPVGISLRRPGLVELARLAQQGAARGAALLSRATGLSLNELTSHRRTETLSWSDITRAEFSGLSEDRGVLTLYVGTRPAQRVEFLDTTEIHGDLLGALENLLGPRLRVS